MSVVDKVKLRELAEKATPGPWGKDGAYVCPKRIEGEAVYIESYNLVAESNQPENVQYIAAVSPTTVLSLLDEIEMLQKDNIRHAIQAMHRLEIGEVFNSQYYADLTISSDGERCRNGILAVLDAAMQKGVAQ